MITREYLVGVDVGTSGCKVAFFNSKLELLTASHKEYTVYSARSGWVELDTSKVWKAICEAVKEASSRVNVKNSSCRISFSTVGEGLIICDKTGKAQYSAILSSDVRSSNYASKISKDLDEAQVYKITGRFPHPMVVLSKILWARDHKDFRENEVLFLDFQSWLQCQLGFKPLTDFSTAGGSMMYDIDNKQWSQELLEYSSVKTAQLPEVGPAGTKIGELNSSIKSAIGLQDCDIASVYLGTMDQMCNALGSSVVAYGDSVCSIGTVMCITVVLDDFIDLDTLRNLRVPRVESAIENQYVTHILLWNGGGSLRWFRDNLAISAKVEAKRSNIDAYEIILGSESESNTIFFIPHLTGSGTPWMDPKSRGAFIGLTLASDNRAMANAVLEGVTFDLKLSIEQLETAGLVIKELKTVGGGSHSSLWLQLIADILAVRVSKPIFNEAGCVGAAILSGYGAGIFPDLKQASQSFVRFEESLTPSTKADFYAKKYQIYKEIYPTLKKLNHKIYEMETGN